MGFSIVFKWWRAKWEIAHQVGDRQFGRRTAMKIGKYFERFAQMPNGTVRSEEAMDSELRQHCCSCTFQQIMICPRRKLEEFPVSSASSWIVNAKLLASFIKSLFFHRKCARCKREAHSDVSQRTGKKCHFSLTQNGKVFRFRRSVITARSLRFWCFNPHYSHSFRRRAILHDDALQAHTISYFAVNAVNVWWIKSGTK